MLFRPLWQRQKNCVVYEKFCKTAQDNSYYFFKYCMEHLPEKERRHIYYIMDPREPDYKNVAGYGRQVVPFMSLKHMLLSLSMKICISSDSTSHLYVWRSKPSIVRRAIKQKEELFLQHGVTAMKRVDQLFGKNGSSPMTYFVPAPGRSTILWCGSLTTNRRMCPLRALPAGMCWRTSPHRTIRFF